MMMATDLSLLKKYARQNSEDAFATLVRRHLDLVYSAAFRQVRSPQLAEEVAQSVFADLARNAERMKSDTVLAAWLYQVTRRTAIDVVRRESRRQLREQIAVEMTDMNSNASEWTQVEPLLDEAMDALDETDRSAILLRYFENKSLREVGQTLGTSDDTAQKRVSRAVERLREFFAKRGITVGASGLVVVISANAVQAAPFGLAVTISTAAALAGTTLTATATATKAIAMTTMQKTFITATLAAVTGAGIYEARQASNLRTQVDAPQRQQATLTEQNEQLIRERDATAKKLAALRDENERLDRNTPELLKMRAQVGTLRQELAAMKSRSAQFESQTNESSKIWTLGSTKWVAEWKDSGLDSPEAAVATYWWALAHTNANRLKECMVFDRGLHGEPVTDIYARREARSEPRLNEGKIGGIRLYSSTQTGEETGSSLPNRAKIDVDVWRRINETDQAPAIPDGAVGWVPARNTYDLMNLDGKWKVIRGENNLKLTLDDEDSAVVANLLMKMPPAQIEELKSKSLIPARTLHVYEELKSKGAK